MADSARDPRDQADLDAVRRELAGLRQEAQAERRIAEDTRQEVKGQSARGRRAEEKQAQAEAQTRRVQAEAPQVTRRAAQQEIAAYQRGLGPQYPFRPPSYAQQDMAAYLRRVGPQYPFQPPGRQPMLPPDFQERAQRAVAAGSGYPPRPPSGGFSLSRDLPPDDRNLNRTLGMRRQLEQVDRVAANEEFRFSGALRESGIALGINARQMERHGALTTEFIAAVSRGEVDVRELGRQLGLTIGKFAGWTVAAASVYGAVNALSDVGRGALDAASGVQLVARVIPEAAHSADALESSFADLSHQFNLPVSDVTQAVYGMGKVFNDLPSALTASKEALFAVKVGELDAATSTRYLTAIVNGFRLRASELPLVFDTINQAQNKFGGNTQQMIAGVAKAAGAFRLAGGGYRELISLIQTGVRLTGASGEQVGTAVSRSAGRVLTAQGQAALKTAGLDPTLQYPQLLAQAMKQAQGASRERVQEIARALVPQGGQFARIFAPILQNQDLYNRVFRQLDPKKAQGSASRELAHALQQPNEQLKQLETNLEQLGVQLARVGGLDPFLAIIKGLNTSIHGAESLLRTLNNFTQPLGPLRHLATILLEVVAAQRLAARFNVGGLLPQRTPFREVLTSPGRQIRNQALTGLDEYRAALQQQRYQVASQAFRAQYEAELAQQNGELRGRVLDQDQINELTARAAGLDQERKALLLEEERVATTRTTLAKDLSGATLRDPQATAARARSAGVPVQFAVSDAGAGIGQYEQAATLTGALAEATKATKENTGAFTQYSEAQHLAGALAETPSFTGAPEGGVGPGDYAQAQQALGAVSETPTFSGNKRLPLAKADDLAKSEEALAAEVTSERTVAQKLGVSGRVAAGALNGADTALKGARGAASAFGGGLKRLALGIGEFIGPLDLILASAFAIYTAHQNQRRAVDQANSKIDEATTHGDVAALRQFAAANRQPHHGAIGTFVNAELTGGAFIGRQFGLDSQSPDEIRRQQAQDAASQANFLKSQQRLGHLLPLRTVSQRLDRAVKLAGGDYNKQVAAYEQAVTRIRDSAEASGGKDAKDQAAQLLADTKDKLAALEAGNSNLNAALRAIGDFQHLGTYQEAASARVGLGIDSPRQGVAKLTGSIERSAQLLVKDPSQATSALQAVQNAQKGIADLANNWLQTALRGADTPGQRRTAYRDFGHLLQLPITKLRGNVGDLRGQLAKDQKGLTQARQAYYNLPGFTGAARGVGDASDSLLYGAGPLLTGGHDWDPHVFNKMAKAARAQWHAVTQKIRGDQQALKYARLMLKISEEQIKGAQEQAAQQEFQSDTQLFDARTQLLQSQTSDPKQKSAIGAQRAREMVAFVKKHLHGGGAELVDYINAQTELNNAVNDATQQDASQAIPNFQTLQALQSARFGAAHVGDQAGTLRYALAQAQRMVTFVRSHGGTTQDIQGAQTAVYEAQTALAEYVQQQAQAMEEARTAFALAGTSNPVRRATIQLRGDRGLLRFQKTPADRLNQLAKIRQDRADLRDSRVQDAYDTLEYEASIGKIQTDAEVQRLKVLLKTKHITRDLRRQITQRIYELTHDQSQEPELNVGSIRLPSLYDVRRLAAGGANGPTVVMHQSIVNNNAIAKTADANEVGQILHKHTRTALSAAFRKAGNR